VTLVKSVSVVKCLEAGAAGWEKRRKEGRKQGKGEEKGGEEVSKWS
jgi:hypothetical protein